MDLTTFMLAMMMLVGSIGVDSILNPRSLIIEAYTASDLGSLHVTDKMLTDAMEEQVARIALTPSIIAKPTVRLDPTPGVGVAIADSVGLGAVATAIQAQVTSGAGVGAPVSLLFLMALLSFRLVAKVHTCDSPNAQLSA